MDLLNLQSDLRRLLRRSGAVTRQTFEKKSQLVSEKVINIALARCIRFVTYILLVFSVLTLVGLVFGNNFHRKFTIENQTQETIAVTPVGTVGEGVRRPLPIYSSRLPLIPSSCRGGFKLEPGESIEIIYDMDDINLSEIVIQDEERKIGQLVVSADLIRDRYSTPPQTHFMIDDLNSLVGVPGSIRDAAREAQAATISPWIVISVLLGPWILWIALILGRTKGK